MRTILYGHDIRLLQPVAGLYLCFGGSLATSFMVNEDDVAGTASILTNMGLQGQLGSHHSSISAEEDLVNDIEEDILGYSTDEADSYYSDDDDQQNDDDFDDFEDDAQLQWEESLEELEQLLKCILIPFFGRYAGRKFAYYVWMNVAAKVYA